MLAVTMSNLLFATLLSNLNMGFRALASGAGAR